MSFALSNVGEQRGQIVVRIIRAAMGDAAIPAGFPILVSGRMAIIEPAFAWLMELATIPGRSHAAETVRTYGEHLHDWFDSLEQSDLDWRGVSEAEIAAWRNRMLSQPSPHTKRPYARSTVNDRVRTVCRFYAWAQVAGGSRACRSTLSMCGWAPADANRSLLMSMHVQALWRRTS